MMHTLERVAKIAEFPTLTARMPMQTTPIRTDGAMGVPVRVFTVDRIREAGNRPSRAIENTSRDAAVWIASVQTNTAIATSTRRSVPHGELRIDESTYGRPSEARR